MIAFVYINFPSRNFARFFDILKFCQFIWILISRHRIGLLGVGVGVVII